MQLFKGVGIIDDDPIFRMIMEKRIRTRFGELPLFFFEDAQEWTLALQDGWGSEEAPIVLLIDINLPGDTGWEILEENQAFFVRHKAAGGRSYITSSSIFYPDIEKAASIPVLAGFLTKPIELNDLGF